MTVRCERLMRCSAFLLVGAVFAGCSAEGDKSGPTEEIGKAGEAVTIPDLVQRQCDLQETFDPSADLDAELRRMDDGVREIRTEAYESGINYELEVAPKIGEECPTEERPISPGSDGTPPSHSG